MGAGRLVELGLLAFVSAGPLVVFPGLREMYRFPKYAILPLAGAVILWRIAVLARREGTVPVPPLFWPVVAYVLAMLLSLTQAANLYQGVFYATQTMVAVSLFWVSALFLTRREAVLRLFHWASLSAALVSILGIAQVWGFTVPGLLATSGGHGSTFGNVNLAAQYLLLVLPMAYALLVLADRGRAAWLRALVAALPTTYLAYSGTRAAWVGVAIAVVALAPLLALPRIRPGLPWRAKAPVLAAVAALVVASTLVPALAIRDFGASRYSPISRFGTLIQGEPSARFRVATTANTLAMFRDHPILGVGKGNFQIQYPLYARAVIVDPLYGPETHVEDAHNDWAQLLAETGIVGFAAFAWILLGLARRFVGSLASPRDDVGRFLAIVSAFALVSLLGEALFDFPFTLPVPSGLFWIVAGVLWASTEVPRSVEPRRARRERKKPAQRKSPWTPAVAFGLLALVATAAAAWGLHALRAEYHFSRGLWAAQGGRFPEAQAATREALRLNALDDRYWFMSGLYHLQAKEYEAAVFDTQKSLALNPNRIASLNNLGAAYLLMGKLPEAVRAFEAAIRIWPDLRDERLNLAHAYTRLGRRDLAAAQRREAARLAPKGQEPQAPASPSP